LSDFLWNLGITTYLVNDDNLGVPINPFNILHMQVLCDLDSVQRGWGVVALGTSFVKDLLLDLCHKSTGCQIDLNALLLTIKHQNGADLEFYGTALTNSA
jgi:hypothetical protein